LNDSEKSRVEVIPFMKPPCSLNWEAVTAERFVPVIWLYADAATACERAAGIAFTVEFVHVTFDTPSDALLLYCHVPLLLRTMGLQPVSPVVVAYFVNVVLPSNDTE